MKFQKNLSILVVLLLLIACGLGCGEADSEENQNEENQGEVDALEGTWVRAESTNNPNDGMLVEVEGDRGVLTHVPDTASSSWSEGQEIWIEITAISEDSYSLRVRGSDANYYPATLNFVDADKIEIDIAHTGDGSDQSWERAQ